MLGGPALGGLVLGAVEAMVDSKRRLQDKRARRCVVRCSSAEARARYLRRPAEDDFLMTPERVLGTGFSGAVVVGTELRSGAERALKSYQKQSLPTGSLEMLRDEVNIYLGLQHPRIVALHQVYETAEQLTLVMELCRGGELHGRLRSRGRFTEQDAARAACDMLSALEYLHAKEIVHRDIKMENWLYSDVTDDACLKLIDFGFSTSHRRRELLRERCGTTAYMAPEVLHGHGYTEKCDMWSFGVVVFALLSGTLPFGRHAERMLECSGAEAVEDDFAEDVSPEARSFVGALLRHDPAMRMSAAQCLSHPWLTSLQTPQMPPPLPCCRSRSAMDPCTEWPASMAGA